MINLKLKRTIKTDDKELLEEHTEKTAFFGKIQIFHRTFDYYNEKVKTTPKMGFGNASD